MSQELLEAKRTSPDSVYECAHLSENFKAWIETLPWKRRKRHRHLTFFHLRK